MENQKKLQAELLQLQINNEGLLEKRVADYQNPNKPPPVPPQYKTQSEVESDNLAQQKQAIDNLRLLGADYAVAAQVSQELLQLPDGVANLVKVNKFFPQIKKQIEEKINKNNINSPIVLMEQLKEFFTKINTAIGVNIRDTDSTNYFDSSPLSSISLLPSSEDYEKLMSELISKGESLNLTDIEVSRILTPFSILNRLKDNSPTLDQLKSIDLLPIIERQNFNKEAEQLIKVYKIPEVKIINNSISELGSIQNGDNDSFFKIINPLYENFKSIKGESSIKELYKFTRKLYKISPLKLRESEASTTSAGGSDIYKRMMEEEERQMRGEETQQIMKGVKEQEGILKDKLKSISTKILKSDKEAREIANTILKDEYIKKKIDNLTSSELRERLAKVTGKEKYYNSTPKIGQKMIIELTEKDGEIRELDKPKFANGEIIDRDLIPDNLMNYLSIACYNENTKKINLLERYNLNTLKELVYDNEKFKKKVKNPQYDPKNNNDDRIIAHQGFGLTDRVLKHFREDNSDLLKLKKGFNKHLQVEKIADSYSSSDSSKEGKGVKKTFKAHRIKLGKGISIPEIPKYREFGKFIVHYPQLIDSNILNLKFPSTGTIPHIKPVYVDENFKEFIIDTLNTGRVNKRHFDSLTEPEKSHFTKIARGAKLTEKLNLKPLTEDREKDDLNRLQLMLGEINAGNDNEKLLKEARALVKKYIANGRINKNKGLEILLELE